MKEGRRLIALQICLSAVPWQIHCSKLGQLFILCVVWQKKKHWISVQQILLLKKFWSLQVGVVFSLFCWIFLLVASRVILNCPSLSGRVVSGRASGFDLWPQSRRCHPQWPTLWRGLWRSVSLPMYTWWLGRRKRRPTSWQVWRGMAWSRSFPNMRTGKDNGTAYKTKQSPKVVIWKHAVRAFNNKRFIWQLVGTYRPKRCGPSGEQDCDSDQEAERHDPHPCCRGEKPAG